MDPLDAYSYFRVSSLSEYLADAAKKDRHITEFMMGIKAGETVVIPGWIGERPYG
jgi:hypothetical protein